MMPGAGPMMPGGYPGGGGAATQPNAQILTDAAGELATEFQSRLRDRIDKGDYGQILVQLASAPITPAAGGGRPGMPGGGYPGMPGSGYPGSGYPGMPGGSSYPGSAAGRPTAGAAAGSAGGAGRTAPGATLPDSGMSAGSSMGSPGISMPGMPMGFGGSGGPYGQAGSPAGSRIAGITFLGEGETKNLLDAAAAQGIDVLVVFEVKVTENLKTNLVNNDTRIVVYDVASGKDLVKSKPVKNFEVQNYRAEKPKSGDVDPIVACLDKLFAALDSDPQFALKMSAIPSGIKPEHVESRVAAILGNAKLERLQALAEIKFFHHRGLASDGLLEKSFQKLLGDADGAKLASGTEEERIEVVSALVPPED